jgi:hypothetical protein
MMVNEMSKQLDAILKLRNEVVQVSVMDEASGTDWRLSKRAGRKSVGNWVSLYDKTKKLPEQFPPGFDKWIQGVKDSIEEFTGMSLDVLPVMPWEDWFRAGVSPVAAAGRVIRQAEEEDTPDAEQMDEDDDDFDLELDEALGISGYAVWAKKLDTYLRKTKNVSLIKAKKTADISNPLLHSWFQSQYPVKKAAMLITGGFSEDDSGAVLRSPSGGVRDLIEQFGFVDEPAMEEKEEFEEETEELDDENALVEHDMTSAQQEVFHALSAVQADDERQSKVKSKQGLRKDIAESIASLKDDDVAPIPSASSRPMDDGMDDVRKAFNAVREDASRGGHVLPFQRQYSGQVDDGDTNDVIDEATVMGGDYGRWGPARKAADSGGKALAAVISKKTGNKYTFDSEGNAQSSDGGTVLWFLLRPESKGEPNYFLGMQITGEKDDPTWNVIVKKGKGLGASTTVTSHNGVKDQELAGAVGKIRDKILKK